MVYCEIDDGKYIVTRKMYLLEFNSEIVGMAANKAWVRRLWKKIDNSKRLRFVRSWVVALARRCGRIATVTPIDEETE